MGVPPGMPMFPVPVPMLPPPANSVANPFVQQYYSCLHSTPHFSHHFYSENSQMAIVDTDRATTLHMGQRAVFEAISKQGCESQTTEVLCMEAQWSSMGAVIVQVDGSRLPKAGAAERRRFVQTFFLAPQDRGGYFVLNDILRFLPAASPPVVGVAAVEQLAPPLAPPPLAAVAVEAVPVPAATPLIAKPAPKPVALPVPEAPKPAPPPPPASNGSVTEEVDDSGEEGGRKPAVRSYKVALAQDIKAAAPPKADGAPAPVVPAPAAPLLDAALPGPPEPAAGVEGNSHYSIEANSSVFVRNLPSQARARSPALHFFLSPWDP